LWKQREAAVPWELESDFSERKCIYYNFLKCKVPINVCKVPQLLTSEMQWRNEGYLISEYYKGEHCECESLMRTLQWKFCTSERDGVFYCMRVSLLYVCQFTSERGCVFINVCSKPQSQIIKSLVSSMKSINWK